AGGAAASAKPFDQLRAGPPPGVGTTHTPSALLHAAAGPGGAQPRSGAVHEMRPLTRRRQNALSSPKWGWVGNGPVVSPGVWWNWQTRYFEVVVGKPVQVQVLLRAPTSRRPNRRVLPRVKLP